jgi:hypothetical protein
MQQRKTGILPIHSPVVPLRVSKVCGEASAASQQGDNCADVRSQTESVNDVDGSYVPKTDRQSL